MRRATTQIVRFVMKRGGRRKTERPAKDVPCEAMSASPVTCPKWNCPGRTSNLPIIESELFGKFEVRSEEHTSELQSLTNLVCRLLLEKKKNKPDKKDKNSKNIINNLLVKCIYR